MCRLRNIAMRDYQESVTTGQDTHTDGRTDTDAGQSDPYIVCTAMLRRRQKYMFCSLLFNVYRANL